MKDCRGQELSVGDSVYLYFGYNRLCPGTISEIKGNKAKVWVDTWPKIPGSRMSMSKWKDGECMIKWEKENAE